MVDLVHFYHGDYDGEVFFFPPVKLRVNDTQLFPVSQVMK